MNFQKVGLKVYFQSWRFYSGTSENTRITWTEATLCHGTIQQMLNEIRPFLAVLLQMRLAYMTKNKGIGILQKSLWLSHFRTFLDKCGLNSCTCLFFLSLVVRLLAHCIVDYVHTDIPVVSQEHILCIVLHGF